MRDAPALSAITSKTSAGSSPAISPSTLCRRSANRGCPSSASMVLLLHPRHRRFDRPRRSWLLSGLFVPNEVITTRITCLACAYRAGVVYPAVDPYLDGLGAAGAGCSHRQLALRPDRTSKPVARVAGITRPTLHNGERPRCPARTLRRRPLP